MTGTQPGAQPLSILVVDDESIVRESLGAWFRDDGFHVAMAESAQEALELVAGNRFDVALVDIQMPNMDGLELLTHLRRDVADLTVIIMTAYATIETAVRALKAGAYDYIVKPFDPEELSGLIERAIEQRSLPSESVRLEESIRVSDPAQEIVGVSQAIRRVLDLVESVAATPGTVLVHGESGTGKELIARAIHRQSRRRFNPLVLVHCGALAEGILESELFGHEEGAFTGASYAHKGKFEQADGGTIFLDEIGDISSKVQVELLRVLEEHRVTRVGGSRSIPVDFRVIAATNRNLEERVASGAFREDLYYRLNVVSIEVPPLRTRPEDIPELAEHFLQQICKAMNREPMRFTGEALARLEAYAWPGNARELRNAVERGVVLGQPPAVKAEHLPSYVSPTPATSPFHARSLSELQRHHIEFVLEEVEWNISQAARALDVDRGTLYAKIKKFGISRPTNNP